MVNQNLRDKFRTQLTNLHAFTVLFVSLLEILGYIILVSTGHQFFSFRNHYLWYGVVAPIIINVITHLIARAVVKRPNVSRRRKNKAIITAALITAFVVAVVHKEYIVTCCGFVFPLILSSVFNDRRLLNGSFLLSILILFLVGVAFLLDHTMTLANSISLLILFGFAFVSFLCGLLSINFSQQNCSVIESQAALNDKLLQNILRDQMTGLYNHHSFVTQLDNHIESFSDEISMCLLMIDVDDFKCINDAYGHANGDVVLKDLAKIIKKHCPNTATAYRYGGEEFAVLFLEKKAKDVLNIGEEILKDFRKHTYEFTKKSITFSAGVAEYTLGLSKDEFFERADKTLYKAKSQGKNRVLVAEQIQKVTA